MSFNYFNNSSVTGKVYSGAERKIDDIDAARNFGLSLFTFTSFTFSHANLIGRTGPTLAQLLAVYDTSTYPWLNDTSFFNVDSNAQGVQMFTVPTTGNYQITMRGGSGGYAYQQATRVGKPATVQATFPLVKSEVLRIVVGQKGRPTATGSNPNGPLTGNAYNSGGGGGSFVFYNLNDSEPLMVAGGGGGGAFSGGSSNSPDASNVLTGAPGWYVTNEGNTRGGPGLVSNQSLGYGGYNNNSTSHKAGGGAGWKGNGLGGHNLCSVNSPYHVQGGWYVGKTLSTGNNTSNGGPFMGGWGGNSQAGNGSQQGGFGGGGGGTGRCGSCQSGGGGGYTGGGISTSTDNTPTKEALAGGGNYVHSSATGGSSSFLGYGNAGDQGTVTISFQT